MVEGEGENRSVFIDLVGGRLQFLVCLYDPHSLFSTPEGELSEVGEHLDLPHRMTVTRRLREGRKMVKQKFQVRFGATEVKFPHEWHGGQETIQSTKLWLVVVEGYDASKKRTVFLTNVPVTDEESLRGMVRRYGDRSAVDEEIQFLKQRFQLGDLQTGGLRAIEMILLRVMVLAAILS